MSISFTPSQVFALQYVLRLRSEVGNLRDENFTGERIMVERAYARFGREFNGYLDARASGRPLTGLLASVKMYKKLLDDTLIPVIERAHATRDFSDWNGSMLDRRS